MLLFLLSMPVVAQQICGNFDAVTVGNVRVNNNVWNDVDLSQCLDVNVTNANWTILSASHNKPTNGPPASYPFSLQGCHWGWCTPNNPMPKQISALSTATSSWSYITKLTGIYNAAYDLWINTTPTTSGQPDGQEIMVWLYKQGAIQPVGSIIASNVSINGALWTVWHGGMVTTYVHNANIVSTSNLNLKNFFADAVNRGYVNPAWYLIAVESGFEIWSGGTGLGTYLFNVNVN
jgi:hypothetical protein